MTKKQLIAVISGIVFFNIVIIVGIIIFTWNKINIPPKSHEENVINVQESPLEIEEVEVSELGSESLKQISSG